MLSKPFFQKPKLIKIQSRSILMAKWQVEKIDYSQKCSGFIHSIALNNLDNTHFQKLL
jgi:hypothetical protein